MVIGEYTFNVTHLRGRTPGSVALALRPSGARTDVQLIGGDCLFPGGVGKTWEPGAFEELLGDVSSQLFGVYDDDTVVYPGHGDDTTLGAERPHLEEWRERGWGHNRPATQWKEQWDDGPTQRGPSLRRTGATKSGAGRV